MIETVASDIRSAIDQLPDEIFGSRECLSSENLERVVAAAALLLRGGGNLTDQHLQTLHALGELLGLPGDAVAQAAHRVQDRNCTLKAVLFD